jgi:xanthine dehydrogenase accessory factor
MTDPATLSWSVPAWPEFGLISDVRPALAAALSASRPSVLASLCAVEGAAPLGQGAQLLFDRGAAAGFISGGCVEGDIALHAFGVLKGGQPQRLIYGRGGPPDIQLLCGSRIELLLERIDPADPAAHRLVALTKARQPALWLSDGLTRVCLAEGEDTAVVPARLRSVLDLAAERPAAAGSDREAIFRRHAPVWRMVVIGGDPISLAIARLAIEAEFDTALVRPKGPREPPPVAGLRYFSGDPGEAFAALGLDPWTAVAICTHDIDIDHDALVEALPSAAGFVGALGSRRRLPERLARLARDGLSEPAIGRLKAPIGLDIGAKSPWQIAVAVVGEAIQALQGQEAARAWPAFAPT